MRAKKKRVKFTVLGLGIQRELYVNRASSYILKTTRH